MTIKMYRWDIKKWEQVDVAGTQGVQPSAWKPWTWANQYHPAQGTATGHAPLTANVEMPQENDSSYRNTTGEYQNPAFGGTVEEAPVPGRGTPEGRGMTAEFASHRSPGQQAVSRFSDQATFSDLWRQQQQWFKDLNASGHDLPPGFAAAQGLPEGTTPKDLMRLRHQHGRTPPALGGAGGSKQNPYTLYTDQGKRDIKGPLGSRFMDNLNWVAGLGNFIPGSAGSRERKHFAQQASLMSGAVRNMLTRGRNNPNYLGSESDRRLVQQAIRADLLPRMGFPKQDVNWLMRTIGGGPERLQAEKDKLGRTAVREHKKTVNPHLEWLNTLSGAQINNQLQNVDLKDRKLWPRADGKGGNLLMSDKKRVILAGADPKIYAQLLAQERGESPQDLGDQAASMVDQLVDRGVDPDEAEELVSRLQTDLGLESFDDTGDRASQPNVFQQRWENIEDNQEALERLRDKTTDELDLAHIDAALEKLGQNKKVLLEEFQADMKERQEGFLHPGEIAAQRQSAIIDALGTHHSDPNVKWDDSQYSQPLYQYMTQKVAPNMGIAHGPLLRVINQAEKGDEGARKMLDNLIYMWGRAIAGTGGIDPTKFAKSVTEEPMEMAWAVLKLR